MPKTVKVKKHIRADGSVVEAHNRVIQETSQESLSKRIKRRKEERAQARVLESLFEEN